MVLDSGLAGGRTEDGSGLWADWREDGGWLWILG